MGDEVAAGEIIGKVGNTALAEYKDGAHLHFELYMDDEMCIRDRYYECLMPNLSSAMVGDEQVRRAIDVYKRQSKSR